MQILIGVVHFFNILPIIGQRLKHSGCSKCIWLVPLWSDRLTKCTGYSGLTVMVTVWQRDEMNWLQWDRDLCTG